MCGIAGMFDGIGSIREQMPHFYAMQDTLTRRGPDQKGLYIGDKIALIHRRLAVVDIENGVQPMILKRGEEEYALVYNGELYNTQELRLQLVQLGHRFRGHSDTEVLLHCYAEWKDQCVDRLNGIFAFAVWEKHTERLFIARDRIGVKPFFYALKYRRFLFGSELKALLAHPAVKPEIDANSLAELIYIGPGRVPGSGVFCGIEELKPAFCGYYTEKGLKLRQYWRLTDRQHTDSFEETRQKVLALVTDSIERQLVSDVPICSFLSGGLDSSIISSIANEKLKEQGKTLQTFSVGYKDNELYFKSDKFQPNDDREYIDCMTDYLGAENIRVLLNTEEIAESLYSAVDARDLPGMADIDSSLLLFCKQVKTRATVALSGECADEIFGGYPWYRDPEIRSRDGFPWSQSIGFRAGFLREEFKKNIDPAEYTDAQYKSAVSSASVAPSASQTERRMREMYHLNFYWFMQTLLDRKDRMSMYSGLEVRVPFCDYRIAEYLYSVPWEMKDYLGREKGLLREAVRGLLPEKVLLRKKSPYPKTHNPAYLKAVSNALRSILADPSSPILKIVKKEALESLLKEDFAIRAATPWYGQLMTLPQTIAYFLQINYWLGAYSVKIRCN